MKKTEYKNWELLKEFVEPVIMAVLMFILGSVLVFGALSVLY